MSSRQWYKVVSARLARRESGGWGRNLAALTLLLLITGASPSLAQELRTAPLTELSYTAGAGQVFELQGSRDLSSWRNVGDVVFGEGGSMREFVEASDAATGYRFYRVKISPSKEFGFAPRALLGRQIDFNDEGGARVFTFETRATGSSGGESFAYNYRKLGDTNGELDIERGDGTSEQIELDFSADLVGLYTRRLSRDGVVTDIDVGTFTFRRTPTDPGGQMPEALTGNTYLFSDGDTHERFDFVSADSGRQIDRADVSHFNYSYARSADSATATIDLASDVVVEFEMQFGGSSCGAYQRRELVDGKLEHVTEGIFSCARSIYHSEGAGSTDVTLPAGELTGRTYVMSDGGTPCQLEFQTLESGRCIQGNLVDEISYDYVVDCNATSIITVRFGTAEFDRYHLNHSDLTFMRHEIRAGVLADTDSGTFAESESP